ncbi:MAG: prepilin-type N-terminal cleavage/methylation domain-containing protein [Candidatus Paceibacterota bacterium]|jgi:prepilin-type N-terminal cleavage/methylation domain-containing protein
MNKNSFFFAKNIESKVAGFTLIELMVVVSLTILFVGAAASYNKTSDKLISLYREEGKIVAQLQQAKSLTVATYLEKDDPGCGYGVHFDATKQEIYLFKDIPETGVEELEKCKSFDGLLFSDRDSIIDVTKLETSRFDFGSEKTILDILFVPPEPKTYIYPQEENAVIQLSSTSVDNLFLTIRVNKFGQISAD